MRHQSNAYCWALCVDEASIKCILLGTVKNLYAALLWDQPAQQWTGIVCMGEHCNMNVHQLLRPLWLQLLQ